MYKLINEIIDRLENANNDTRLDQLRIELIPKLDKLKVELDIQQFKLDRLLKDKNILNSLLNKTSRDLKKALQELEKKAEELNILLNTIPAFVFFKDKEFRYRLVNQAFLDFVKLDKKLVLGKRVSDLFPDYLKNKEYLEKEKEVIYNGKSFYNIEEVLEKSNEQLWVNTNLAPVVNSKGEIIGLIGVSWDVTSQKNYQQQLKRAKELAEEGVKAKTQFLTNMSHEIRTPLNAVIGMAEILKKTKINKKQEEYLNILLSSGDELLNLINDIFEYSALDAGKIKLEKESFELQKLIKEVYNENKQKAEKKKIKFEVLNNSKTPSVVIGDKKKLKTVVNNLVDNAIKFTNNGYVRVHFSCLENRQKGNCIIKFNIEDTGIGIDKENSQTLFTSFSPIDSTITKQYKGTGLGLAISKKLVDLMGGEIGFESARGKGSDFWFTTTLELPESSSEDEINKEETEKIMEVLKDFRILLVEDNLINQKITKLTLMQTGCKVDVANNGLEAVEKYRKNNYDLILMDLQMPVMDGLEATRQIRKIEQAENVRHAFIVALTANALPSDMENCMLAGMEGFIAKPFKPMDLFRVLHQLIIQE